MRINLITSINNQAGLQTETEMLRDFLQFKGHWVFPTDIRNPRQINSADLNIFMELLNGNFFPHGRKNWFIPNPEWYYPEWDKGLAICDLVLAKTFDAEVIFKRLHRNVRYTGFMSPDKFDPDVKREKTFLHVQGKSTAKNTDAVVNAWRHFKIDVPLTVISASPCPAETYNTRWLSRVPAPMLKQLQNENQFHLCPSAYEGFGHYIHEGLSCGAVVVTTNSAPMNEFEGCPAQLRVQPIGYSRQLLGRMAAVGTADIKAAVDKCLALTDAEIKTISDYARASYEQNTDLFQRRLVAELDKYDA